MTKKQKAPDRMRIRQTKATPIAADDSITASPSQFRRKQDQGWHHKFVRRLLKGIATLIILSILGVAILLGLLWNEHRTAITLPAPTGPFSVGRLMYDWVDASRTDSLAPVANQKRELTVWMWYPATPTKSSKPVDYLPAPWRTALARYQGGLGSTFLSRDPSLVHAHSISNAEVSPAQPTYPVVIMRSGIGALNTDYTTLAEDLASHGYIVVGMDAPYSTSVVVFSDGRVVTRTNAGNPSDSDLPVAEQDRLANNLITIWSADTRFVLDKLEQLNRSDPSGTFTHRLNMQEVGIFGHSFGGATAAQFCHDDTRCKAGIDLDGAPYGNVIQQGLHHPFMFLLSDHGNPSDAESRTIISHIQSIYNSLPSDARFWMTLRGTSHFNFSDQSLLKDTTLSRLAGAIGSIDARRGLAVTSGCIQQFFDIYLKGKPAELTKTMPQLYPEIQLEAH
ncbi:MAG TPA: hypothetical protein VFB12_11685 [Ktedonobacteraceae bacterium]|nr:hypothetical protein [Ktedonobacteraceae bacterium]